MTIRKRVLRFSVLPAALLALASVSPASAQWGPPVHSGRIHPAQIEQMVRSMGYQPVADPRPRGPLWVTHAVDREGQHVRVLIDGFTGRLIDVLRRPMPPQNISIAPPPNSPQQSDPRFPPQYPQANVPRSDYEDDGPDYDYRNVPLNQRPVDWPPSRPNTQSQQQGPNVIPFEPRSDNNRLPAPKTTTVKKKETKEKKNDTTAAVTPEKEKAPSPKARPTDAPKAEVQKKDEPKVVQMPKMPATDNQRPPQPQITGAVPPAVQPLDIDKSQPSVAPPVQPPF